MNFRHLTSTLSRLKKLISMLKTYIVKTSNLKYEDAFQFSIYALPLRIWSICCNMVRKIKFRVIDRSSFENTMRQQEGFRHHSVPS